MSEKGAAVVKAVRENTCGKQDDARQRVNEINWYKAFMLLTIESISIAMSLMHL